MSMKDAIRDGYLVDYTFVRGAYPFQRQGIRGVDLAEEGALRPDRTGMDPDDIDIRA